MKTTKKVRKTTFLKELKVLAEKNNLNFGHYTQAQLFSKLGRLRYDKKLKGVTTYNYLLSNCALWWVEENF
jgi:hypothetical protein